MSRTHLAVILASACTCLGALALAQTPPMESKPAAPVDPKPELTKADSKRIDVAPADLKWLDRVPKDERAAFDELLGWAPAEFTTDLEWIGGDAADWNDLRGKVVVVQSFTTGTMAGRNWPTRVANALEAHKPSDLRIIALHTPEEIEAAKEFLAKKPTPPSVTLALDKTGAYCDALAIYRDPTNIVIDRNGVVRFAALNPNGLEKAVEMLIAEKFDQNVVAAQREGDPVAAPSASDVEFPAYVGKIDHAMDIRGKRAPDFHVSQWLNTDPPNAKDKVVVVDFWATWCGPCVASIPHMNELADRYRDDVLCVGISDEKPADFEKGLAGLKSKAKVSMETFKYALALDPNGAMKNAIKVMGIPHCLVMDRNWIVRWQGHPAALDAATLGKIVDADKGGAGAGGTSGKGSPKSGGKRKRWTGG